LKNFLLISLLSISFIFAQYDVLLGIENIDEDAGTFDIRMINSEPVGGYQIAFNSITLLNLGGGTSTANGFFASPADNQVIAFSLTGATIPVGNAILLEVTYSGATPTLTGVIGTPNGDSFALISDAAGVALITEEYIQDSNGNGCASSELDCNNICDGGGIEDCAGACDGSAVVDSCNECAVAGDTTCVEGCDGNFANDGSHAVDDVCGICDGDNSTCTDCFDVVNPCGDGTNDCDNWAYTDGCDECVGGTTGLDACPQDCNGVDGGTAFIDNCSECVAAGDTSCVEGCDGNYANDGSHAVYDECGVCDGGNATCSDCAGVPNGLADWDPNCYTLIPGDICVGGDTGLTQCMQDCNNEWGGSSVNDECGVCNNYDEQPAFPYGDCDCEGEPDGLAVLDDCDICSEGTTGLEANADKDDCGECPGEDNLYGYTGTQAELGGENSTCTGCMDANATNYNSTVGDPIQSSNECSGGGCTYDCDGTLGGSNIDCCYYALDSSTITVTWVLTVVKDTTTTDAQGNSVPAVYMKIKDLTEGIEAVYRNWWFSATDSLYLTENVSEVNHFFTDVSYGDSADVKLQIITNEGAIFEKSERVELKAPYLLSNNNSIPTKVWLSDNYPNPFNPVTSIEYSVEKAGHVNIAIYNVMGHKVYDLVSGYHSPGARYSAVWNSNTQSNISISTGIYFYEMRSGNYIERKKMVLIK